LFVPPKWRSSVGTWISVFFSFLFFFGEIWLFFDKRSWEIFGFYKRKYSINFAKFFLGFNLDKKNLIWKKWKITRRWCKNGERRLETKKKSKNPFSFFKKSPFIFLATHWKPKYIYESFLNFFPSFRRLKTSKITYLSIFFISLFAEISPVEKTTLRCVCELPNVFFFFFFFFFNFLMESRWRASLVRWRQISPGWRHYFKELLSAHINVATPSASPPPHPQK